MRASIFKKRLMMKKHGMNRRGFIRQGIQGSLAAVASSALAGRSFGDEAAIPFDVHSLVEAEDPQVLRLLEDVFRECVLGKLRPPEGVLRHSWITAGGNFYGQWIWDAMFVVDLLSLLPGTTQSIRDVFQNYWDFQDRWNAQSPDYARDMVACMIEPNRTDWLSFPAYSQIPILAWGMERVYRRNGDRSLIQKGLAPLERFHDWYWRERDVTHTGLVAVGAYSGGIQRARYETFDYECNLDSLKLTSHPTRNGTGEGAWYGDICPAGNTAYLIMAERSLQRLAAVVGDDAMVARRQNRIDKSVAVSGRPLGVTFLGMSCTIATMMFDGLCSKYGDVRLKNEKTYL